jgi:quercetin dioxygenase-like cupin family protein
MTQQEWIEKLKKEEYTDVAVHTFPPNMEFPEHTHDKTTLHVILEGTLTSIEKTKTLSFGKGERFEILAGTSHSAKCGSKGCTFVVGVKT